MGKTKMSLTAKRSAQNQYLATICVSFLGIGYGTAIGWTSPAIPILLDGSTGYNLKPITYEAASWISSMLCCGGFIGCFVVGYLCHKFGCKIAGYITSIPLFVSWILIVMASNEYLIVLARILAGFCGGGVFAILPQFVAEMSEDRIRGTLGSFLVLSINAGILFAYIVGYIVSYENMCWILMSVPIIFFIGWFGVPETPTFLIRKNQLQMAQKSLCFYRNMNSSNYSVISFEMELSKIKTSLNKSDDCGKTTAGITYNELITNPIRKALIIAIPLMFLNQLCGIFPMISFTAIIFQEAGSDWSPNASAIIVAMIQIVGSFVSIYLVDKAGRKILLITSFGGIAFGQGVMSLYSYLKFLEYDVAELRWIPLISFSLIIFAASYGAATLPWVILSEILPEKIKASATAFCLALVWILAFLFVKYFTALTEALGMHGVMFLFSSFSLAGMFYAIFVLPETKGKSFDEIAKSLM